MRESVYEIHQGHHHVCSFASHIKKKLVSSIVCYNNFIGHQIPNVNFWSRSIFEIEMAVFDWSRSGCEIVKTEFEWNVQVPFLQVSEYTRTPLLNKSFFHAKETPDHQWNMRVHYLVSYLQISMHHYRPLQFEKTRNTNRRSSCSGQIRTC